MGMLFHIRNLRSTKVKSFIEARIQGTKEWHNMGDRTLAKAGTTLAQQLELKGTHTIETRISGRTAIYPVIVTGEMNYKARIPRHR